MFSIWGFAFQLSVLKITDHAAVPLFLVQLNVDVKFKTYYYYGSLFDFLWQYSTCTHVVFSQSLYKDGSQHSAKHFSVLAFPGLSYV